MCLASIPSGSGTAQLGRQYITAAVAVIGPRSSDDVPRRSDELANRADKTKGVCVFSRVFTVEIQSPQRARVDGGGCREFAGKLPVNGRRSISAP